MCNNVGEEPKREFLENLSFLTDKLFYYNQYLICPKETVSQYHFFSDCVQSVIFSMKKSVTFESMWILIS